MSQSRVLAVMSFMLFIMSCNYNYEHHSSDKNQITPFSDQLGIEIYDPEAFKIVDTNAMFEVLAEGFYWSEGPLWVDEIQSLIFSDVPANKIYKWNEGDSLSIYLEWSGHTGRENKNSNRGSNGLILDDDNNLLICQHGDRRVAKLNTKITEPKPDYKIIADSYKGKLFNSPNDIDIAESGKIYFTDPPYGRPDNKTGEIGINGVYVINPNREVKLLVDSLRRPNGIRLSLDEKTLYINHSDPQNPVLYSYEIGDNGSLQNGRILFDFKEFAEDYNGLPDGLKVHKSGNIFATGPGGVHIISSEGKHLAFFKTIKSTSNCAFNSDYSFLYTTTTDLLLRIKLVASN